MALALAEYDYDIEYIKGTDNTLADLLSHMVVAETASSMRVPKDSGGDPEFVDDR